MFYKNYCLLQQKERSSYPNWSDQHSLTVHCVGCIVHVNTTKVIWPGQAAGQWWDSPGQQVIWSTNERHWRAGGEMKVRLGWRETRELAMLWQGLTGNNGPGGRGGPIYFCATWAGDGGEAEGDVSCFCSVKLCCHYGGGVEGEGGGGGTAVIWTQTWQNKNRSGTATSHNVWMFHKNNTSNSNF